MPTLRSARGRQVERRRERRGVEREGGGRRGGRAEPRHDGREAHALGDLAGRHAPGGPEPVSQGCPDHAGEARHRADRIRHQRAEGDPPYRQRVLRVAQGEEVVPHMDQMADDGERQRGEHVSGRERGEIAGDVVQAIRVQLAVTRREQQRHHGRGDEGRSPAGNGRHRASASRAAFSPTRWSSGDTSRGSWRPRD